MRFWGTSRVTSAMRGSVAGSRSAPPRGTSPFGTTWMGPRRRSARRHRVPGRRRHGNDRSHAIDEPGHRALEHPAHGGHRRREVKCELLLVHVMDHAHGCHVLAREQRREERDAVLEVDDRVEVAPPLPHERCGTDVDVEGPSAADVAHAPVQLHDRCVQVPRGEQRDVGTGYCEGPRASSSQ